jgi:hypothetical protein
MYVYTYVTRMYVCSMYMYASIDTHLYMYASTDTHNLQPMQHAHGGFLTVDRYHDHRLLDVLCVCVRV